MKTVSANIIGLVLILMTQVTTIAQENINRTDLNGLKQGHWIKKYPNGQIMYDGYFADNKPVGEFKRFDEDGNPESILFYGTDNDTVKAQFFHPNGYIAGKGCYLDRKKTGEWLYFSDYIDGRLLMKCNYTDDMIEGIRIKYHWNGNIAEKLVFERGIKSGTWLQYFTDGTLCLESSYSNGNLNGDFRSWHNNGKPEITGQYSKNVRVGTWIFYDTEGRTRKEIRYNNKGIPENRAELIREETEYLDRLEKEGGKIADPEITGIIK